jgi:hypothetical protein
MRYLLLCTALAACTSSSGSTGTLTATWSLKTVDGSAATCMAGYDTLKISAFFHNADFGSSDPGTEPVVGLFPCDAGTGTLELQIDGAIDDEPLDGMYDVQWDETDSTGGTSVATDLQAQLDRAVAVDLSGGAATASVTMYQDGGYGWFDWRLFGMSGMDYLDSCEGAGVDKVDIAVTDTTTSTTTHVLFPCGTSDDTATGAAGVAFDGIHVVGAGIAPLAAGDYTYVATAYAGASIVGTSDAEDTSISPRNHITIFADSADITLTNR